MTHAVTTVKVAYLQTRPRIMEVESNVGEAVQRLREMDVDLVVLPELFNTGYALTKQEVERASERVPGGPTTETLREVAEEERMGIVAGIAERSGTRIFNSAVLVTPSGAKVHRKVHLFGEEKGIFHPGDSFKVHRFLGSKVGMMVCFDWFFPESCRTLMLKGAEIIAHPANLVLPFWPKAALTRAVENHVFIVTASRVGVERGLRFIGRSRIVSPGGDVLASAGAGRMEQAVVEIDPSLARDKRVTPQNDITRDRRPDAYSLG
jgi:predicted amidohydrolase